MGGWRFEECYGTAPTAGFQADAFCPSTSAKGLSNRCLASEPFLGLWVAIRCPVKEMR